MSNPKDEKIEKKPKAPETKPKEMKEEDLDKASGGGLTGISDKY